MSQSQRECWSLISQDTIVMNLFNRHDRKWVRVHVFVEQVWVVTSRRNMRVLILHQVTTTAVDMTVLLCWRFSGSSCFSSFVLLYLDTTTATVHITVCLHPLLGWNQFQTDLPPCEFFTSVVTPSILSLSFFLLFKEHSGVSLRKSGRLCVHSVAIYIYIFFLP